jgi:hypothetical protein
MTTDATRAKGEAMPAMNRRTALATTGAALAAALSGVAAPAAAPTTAAPEDQEPFANHPWTRARDLARQLADVLAEDDTIGAGPSGEWFAEVYPSSLRDRPIMFGSISSREWPRRNISLPMQRVIEAHVEARKAFEVTCGLVDCDNPSKSAWRRYNRAYRAEDKALLAVCAFHPHGRADGKAKAAHLKRFIDGRELAERHILALVNSAVL